MRADEFLLCGGRLAFWSRRDAMALEHVAHGLLTDRVPEMGQGTHNAIIAPRAVLLGHADHQRLQLLVDLRPPQHLALLRAIKFLGDMFYTRAYRMAAARIGVTDYRNLVDEKLRTAGDLYQFMVDEFHQARAFLLEVMVVAILIIELAKVFWPQ